MQIEGDASSVARFVYLPFRALHNGLHCPLLIGFEALWD